MSVRPRVLREGAGMSLFEKDGKKYAVDPSAPDRIALFRAMWSDGMAECTDEECERIIQEPLGEIPVRGSQ